MAKLSHHDLISSAWHHVKLHIGAQIEKHRTELEKTSRSHEDTMVVRGQIKALRLLLKEMEQGAAGEE